MKLELSLIPYIKVTFKWIKNLSVKPYTIKLPGENISRTQFGPNHSNTFLETSSRVTELKTKINKWDLNKCKSFCTAKETINRRKNN